MRFGGQEYEGKKCYFDFQVLYSLFLLESLENRQITYHHTT